MKTRKSAYLVMAAALISSMTGCSKTENILENAPDPLAVKAAPESIVFDWQEAYENKLLQFKKSSDYTPSSMFDLRDITDDNIPELIISLSDDPSAGCEIYSLIGTNTALIGSCGSSGQFDFIPSVLVIGYEYSGDGFTVGEYQKLSEGTFNTDFDFFTNVNSASDGAVIRYEINDESVSLGEFEEQLDAYRNEDSIRVGRKYTLGDEAIKYAIHCGESWNSVLTDEQKKKYKDRISAVFDKTSVPDAAFELVDLDGNSLPEVVVSTGMLEESSTRIFYIDSEGVKEIEVPSDSNGGIRYDISGNIFYSYDESGKLSCRSLTEENISGFKPSESTMLCGRKYSLSKENIKLAFA